MVPPDGKLCPPRPPHPPRHRPLLGHPPPPRSPLSHGDFMAIRTWKCLCDGVFHSGWGKLADALL
jgi:hypothetical protein